MSWDVFVQDIPEDATRPDDIPDDFKPSPLRLDRASIIHAARATDMGTIDDTDPSWVHWEGTEFHIELNLPDDPVGDFAMHCRGHIETCRAAAVALVTALGVRAFAVEDGVVIG